jgi:signal transduction histidine kinase
MPLTDSNGTKTSSELPMMSVLPVQVAGSSVAALGIIAMAGWLLDLPIIAAFGSDTVPMAPSTALLFVTHGLLLLIRAGATPRGPVMRSSRIVEVAAALVAIILLALSSLGIRSNVEHLGFDISGNIRGVPIGHISPVTALCFLLASLSELASPHGSIPDNLRRRSALGAALLLLGTALVFMLAYLFGNPLLYDSGFIPPALGTAAAFAMLAAGLLSVIGSTEHSTRGPGRGDSATIWFLLVFVLLSSGMMTTGHFYHKHHETRHRTEIEHQLSAVADLRAGELNQWHRERLGSGTVFLDNENFSDLVQKCLESPDDQHALDHLRIWLRQVRRGYPYDRVFLLDASGVEVAADPAIAETMSAHIRAAVPGVLQSPKATFLDFYREGPDQPIHLAVMVPIRAARKSVDPIGVLVLRIDPFQSLYPILRRWPTASPTAETLIVRREGDEVLFLNEPRFSDAPAMSLRIPVADVQLPAARAVLGFEGIVEGVDYRGESVIAAVRHVPDTPWYLVARMDTDEVYAQLTERLWQMALIVAILLFGAAALLGLAWRQQSLRYYRERFEAAEALRVSEAKLRQRNDELTSFAYTVSHDLKSPLVTIQTFAGYLARDIPKGNVEAIGTDLGFIHTAADKMSRLLDDLLELSRLGRNMNQPVIVPLREVVDEALALVAGRIAERNVRVDFTAEPILLHGDRDRLIEVFQNLVDNAVKFMSDRPDPLVEIGSDTSDGRIVLFVRDNGAGIDPRHIHRLFGLFEKLDPSSEGTGMGLALVRRIIELHGGRISAESDGPGLGSCFRFTIAGTTLDQGMEVSP